MDASLEQGRFLQNAGIFRIDPDMTWGDQLISNDAQGGYYRLNYQSRQWLADIGVDEVRSVSGLGANTTFVTGDSRYQLSRDWGVGGVANTSHTDGGTSWSLEGFLDHSNAAGTARAQVDFAETPAGRDATLTLNEAWATPVGMRLSTSAAVERISGAVIDDLQQDSTVLSIAAYGGGQFTAAFRNRRQCALGGRGTRTSGAGGFRQCLADLAAIPSLGDSRHRITTAGSGHGRRSPWNRR